MLNIINYNENTTLHVSLWQRYNIIELVLPGVEYLVHVQVWYWFHLVAPVIAVLPIIAYQIKYYKKDKKEIILLHIRFYFIVVEQDISMCLDPRII